MFSSDILVLGGAAASIGVLHTLMGPDHYLPFVVMGRARHWPRWKTLAVTAGCGVGHVASSVLLGLAGVALGTAIGQLEAFEAVRGSMAAWLLIGFGLAYAVWGVHKAIQNRPHRHAHVHEDGTMHQHGHGHHGEHAHVHEAEAGERSLTPWLLFIIFVLGPCEPLIPLLMYPAAEHSWAGMIFVTMVFSVATVGTMLATVAGAAWGLQFCKLGPLERFSHALAGAAICMSGLAIQMLGL